MDQKLAETIADLATLVELAANCTEKCILAAVQKRCLDLFGKTFNSLMKEEKQEDISKHIVQGANGCFVEACLLAMEIHWPDVPTRLGIVEDAAGILHNCLDASVVLQKDGFSRTCGVLQVMEPLIAMPDNDELASGALESLALVLDKLMSQDVQNVGSAACICTILLRLAKRPALKPYGLSACLGAVWQYLFRFDSPALECEKTQIKELLQGEMNTWLKHAVPYLKVHEIWSHVAKEPEVLAGMNAIRDSRAKLEEAC